MDAVHSVSARDRNNGNVFLIRAVKERVAVEEKGAAGFDGKAGCAGSQHRIQRAHTDDRHVEAHVLVRLGYLHHGEAAM